MNILHYEVLNALHARGRDEWTTEQVLTHINDTRGDHSEVINARKVSDALSALIDDDKVVSRKAPRDAKGRFVGGRKYRIAPITYAKPNYDDAWRTFKVSVKLWPYVLIFSVVMLLGVGLIDTLNFIVF